MSDITPRQRQILDVIVHHQREHGFPPSVREIAAAVGLGSPATVKVHLDNLSEMGYIRKDPAKPRSIDVRFDPTTGATLDRRPTRHVPLVGEVAAGTDVLASENVSEIMPLPADFTGDGEVFMLQVKGDSMINKGILDGDYVVVQARSTAASGDIIVAGIPGDEATVKTLRRARGGMIVLEPANDSLEPMEFEPDDVQVYGKVVTLLRRI